MSTAITTAGERLIAQKHISGEPLVIDQIILANMPSLDLAQPVDREQGKPAAENIVHEYVIPEEFKSFVNPNQVVYSMLLGSDIGNFSFNWLGLYSSADATLVAVTELPLMDKWQTEQAISTLGNNLTRNFLLEFSGAKAVTNITVEAKTWQVDFTARLRGIDERERQSNRDIYGCSCFFNDGFLVEKVDNAYVLKAGAGYVEGIRCVLEADTQLAVSALPKNVFIDVSLQQQGSNVVPVIVPVLTASKADYTDENNTHHYCIHVAEIAAAGVVTDIRRTEAVVNDLVEYLKGKADSHAQDKDDPHETMVKVDQAISEHANADDPHDILDKIIFPEKSSSLTSSSEETVATSNAVKKLNDAKAEKVDVAKCFSIDRLMHLRDERPAGASSGTFQSGAWRVRMLNREKINSIAGASLNASSGEFILPARKYFFDGWTTAFAINGFKARLYDVTNGRTLIVGSAENTANSDNSGSHSLLQGVIDLTETTTLRIEQRCEVTASTYGMGIAVGMSEIEVYADAKIWGF